MQALTQSLFSGAWGAALVRLLNMSAAAGVLICAVALLRLALKNAPKWTRGILWAIVAVQLVCPVAPASPLSVYGLLRRGGAAAEKVEVFHALGGSEKPLLTVDTPRIAAPAAPEPAPQTSEHSVYLPAAGALWLAGVAAMLLYALVSYLCLRRQVRASLPLEECVMLCDDIDTPFLLGFFRPRVYLPSKLPEARRAAVLAHERAHLRRGDHIWKPLGFLLLSLHWFNPLVWLAYVLFCRDMELACDERVVREMDATARADYSQALLDCSLRRSPVRACPLAFGELGVKERVKRVLSYKKPAFWIVVPAVAACCVVAVCFLTRPADTQSPERTPEVTPTPYPSPQPTGTPEALSDPMTEDAGFAFFDPATSRTYLLGEEYDVGPFSAVMRFYITLDMENGRFEYYETPISSYIGHGAYTLDGGILTIADGRVNRFRMEGDRLIWLAEGSDNFTFVKLTDGAVFYLEETAAVRQLSLDDVQTLATKGDGLSWDDFAPFACEEVGSGLYILRYPIDASFDLLIGAMSPEEAPLYYHLRNRETDAWIEIRTEDVAAFLSAYGAAGDDVLTEPPALSVSTERAGIHALSGSWSWHYDKGDGTGVGIEADSEHPLMLQGKLPILSPSPDGLSRRAGCEVTLRFDTEPDEVSVSCWSTAHWGDADAEAEDVPLTQAEQFGFALREGGYIYQITAVWNRSDRWGGRAEYSFYGDYRT